MSKYKDDEAHMKKISDEVYHADEPSTIIDMATIDMIAGQTIQNANKILTILSGIETKYE